MTNDQLDGGTQGHGAGHLTNVGGTPGGTNSVGSPAGASRPPGHTPPGRGTANQADQDAEAAFEDGSRKPSGTEAKLWARDDADVDTTAGSPFGGVAPERQKHKMQEDKD